MIEDSFNKELGLRLTNDHVQNNASFEHILSDTRNKRKTVAKLMLLISP